VEFTIVPGLRGLFDADEERGLDLVDTVRTYLRCGGNLERTAARLFLHRNSVRYRIERARGYLGTSLSDPGQWLQLEMALAIHSLRHPPRNIPRRRA
jgi:purine catabolism regulator